MRLYETQEPIVTKLQNNQCNRFVERQLFEVFLNLGSTNQMIIVQHFNIQIENSKINFIGRNKKNRATNRIYYFSICE